MTVYNNFDLNCYSEDSFPYTEEGFDSVMQMMAEETEGFENLPQDEQTTWEREQDELKDWLGNYSNIDNGKFYNGIAV